MFDLASYIKTLNGKPVAVFGLGVSGLSVVKSLVNAGANVVAWDDNEESREKVASGTVKLEDLSQSDLSNYAFLLLAPGIHYTHNPHPVVVNAQNYNLEIIGDLELLHRCRHSLKTIGITGTNGKSTTTALMSHVLNHNNVPAVMAGNIGKPVFDLDVTDDKTILVLEISSYQMDLCPTFRPDISILLNITPDHLDRHGSMKAYVAAKAKMLEGHGVAVIDIDDDFTQEIFNQTFIQGNRKAIPVSIKNNIVEGFFVKDGILYQNKRGEDLEIASLKEFENLKGQHNHQNIVSVYAASKELELKDHDIFKACTDFPGLPHRQYLFHKVQKVKFINDSKATNAEAAAKALSSFENIFWIIGGRKKETGLQGLEIFRDKIIKTYVIGECAHDFALWLDYNKFPFEICKTLDLAVEKSYKDSLSYSDDATVLLSPACASWDQFKSFEHRGNLFMDLVLSQSKVAA